MRRSGSGKSMRTRPDRSLAEPYRSWIDRSRPLPPQVRLLPRTVSVTLDLITFLGLGGLCGGMGAFLLVMLSWVLEARPVPWLAGLVLAAVGLGLVLVPLLLGRRLWLTLGARRDQRGGVLRQGILLGPAGLLVRLEPNRCYPVGADRFVGATYRESRGRTPKTFFRLETWDGWLEFFAERIEGRPQEVTHSMRAARSGGEQPAAVKPPPPPPQR